LTKESHFFAELYQAYSAEIEDNRTDSEGKVVLQKRLSGLRSQFDGYLPMMEDNPEMVSVVFHDAFTFESRDTVRAAIGCDPDDAGFPSWPTLASTMTVAPWAVPFVDRALADETGDRFMVIAGCLEYIRATDASKASAVEPEADGHERPEGGDDGDGDEPGDLAEAGDDWLSQQGFDSQR